MKKLAAITITAVALAAAAFAQTPESLKMHLSMPATVSGVVLSPGDYAVRLWDDTNNAVLSFESETTNTHVLALANSMGVSLKPGEVNHVSLVRDGDTYRIDKVWIGDEGYEVISKSAK